MPLSVLLSVNASTIDKLDWYLHSFVGCKPNIRYKYLLHIDSADAQVEWQTKQMTEHVCFVHCCCGIEMRSRLEWQTRKCLQINETPNKMVEAHQNHAMHTKLPRKLRGQPDVYCNNNNSNNNDKLMNLKNFYFSLNWAAKSVPRVENVQSFGRHRKKKPWSHR